jgi:hypothetical protein
MMFWMNLDGEGFVDHAKFILYFESNLEPLKSLTQAREIDL